MDGLDHLDVVLRELSAAIAERLARVTARPPQFYWCDECHSWQIMETLEDGTRECMVCRLRNELQSRDMEDLNPTG